MRVKNGQVRVVAWTGGQESADFCLKEVFLRRVFNGDKIDASDRKHVWSLLESGGGGESGR